MFLMCACFVQKKGIAEKAINFILGRKKMPNQSSNST